MLTARAYCSTGYAPTLGDDHVEPLADLLSSFLQRQGVPVDETAGAARVAAIAALDEEIRSTARELNWGGDG